jgi:hypothetical protein
MKLVYQKLRFEAYDLCHVKDLFDCDCKTTYQSIEEPDCPSLFLSTVFIGDAAGLLKQGLTQRGDRIACMRLEH